MIIGVGTIRGDRARWSGSVQGTIGSLQRGARAARREARAEEHKTKRDAGPRSEAQKHVAYPATSIGSHTSPSGHCPDRPSMQSFAHCVPDPEITHT